MVEAKAACEHRHFRNIFWPNYKKVSNKQAYTFK